MNSKTIYRCEGTCNGATFEEGKNCGAKDCNQFDVPLKPYTQCNSCAERTASGQNGKAHGCEMCMAH